MYRVVISVTVIFSKRGLTVGSNCSIHQFVDGEKLLSSRIAGKSGLDLRANFNASVVSRTAALW
jgi:hypothetical protein